MDDVARARCDPLTLGETCEAVWETSKGTQGGTARDLNQAWLSLEPRWGGTAGNWGRRPFDLDEIERMAVARRPEAE